MAVALILGPGAADAADPKPPARPAAVAPVVAAPVPAPPVPAPPVPAPPEPAAPAPRAGEVVSLGGKNQTDEDPVVAIVDGHPIHLGTLGKATDTLPETLRELPFDTLYPALLQRTIDHQVLAMMARRQGMDETPAIKRDIEAAIDRILEAAYLRRETAGAVTDQAIQQRYNLEFANRPATEEVRARHILVPTETEAKDVLRLLREGGDFAALAVARSRDPDARHGGDLGFFRREQVWPNFADVAFSLQPGEIGPTPVRNEFGWHVVKVEERRLVAPPSLPEARETLRQELMAQAIRDAVKKGRAQLQIREFNIDGSVKMDSLRREDNADGAPAR